MIDCSICEALCCRNYLIPVEVLAGDIVRMSDYLGIRPVDYFERYCEVFPFNLYAPDEESFVPRITLRNPCPLLEVYRCSLESVKPVTCLLFPIKSVIQDAVSRRLVEECPCLPHTPDAGDRYLYEAFSERVRPSEARVHNSVFFPDGNPHVSLSQLGLLERANSYLEFIDSDGGLDIAFKYAIYCGYCELLLKDRMNNEALPYMIVEHNTRRRRVLGEVNMREYFIERLTTLGEREMKAIAESSDRYFDIRMNVAVFDGEEIRSMFLDKREAPP